MQRIDERHGCHFEKMVEFLQTGKYFEAIEIAETLQKQSQTLNTKLIRSLLAVINF